MQGTVSKLHQGGSNTHKLWFVFITKLFSNKPHYMLPLVEGYVPVPVVWAGRALCGPLWSSGQHPCGLWASATAPAGSAAAHPAPSVGF